MKIEKQKIYAVIISLISIILIGFLDFYTGYELSFFIFYIFPVAVAAWYVGFAFGLFLSFTSVLIWFYADMLSGHTYSEEWIIFWNGGVRLVFFIIDSFLLVNLKKRLDFEKEWARIDGLTGALNGRGFRERLGTILPFSARTKNSFALAFIDLDNFKKVNDTQGHAVGDMILQRSVKTMIENLRVTDFIGRMGGDEFAIFLPATDASGAEQVLKNLRKKLLDQVEAENWSIGYSMGAVTVDMSAQKGAPDQKDIIRAADELMYKIKKSSKNDLLIELYKA